MFGTRCVNCSKLVLEASLYDFAPLVVFVRFAHSLAGVRTIYPVLVLNVFKNHSCGIVEAHFALREGKVRCEDLRLTSRNTSEQQNPLNGRRAATLSPFACRSC